MPAAPELKCQTCGSGSAGERGGQRGPRRGAERAASVINNHKPADARTSRGATPAAR